ncbi:helix-turn-helix domain-containing protein [Synechococcus sp. UW140]
MRQIYDAKFRGEVRKWMSPASCETVTEISRATGISRQTLYSWRHL